MPLVWPRIYDWERSRSASSRMVVRTRHCENWHVRIGWWSGMSCGRRIGSRACIARVVWWSQASPCTALPTASHGRSNCPRHAADRFVRCMWSSMLWKRSAATRRERCREVVVAGERVPYSAVVATLLLPALLKRRPGLPKDIETHASRLRCRPGSNFRDPLTDILLCGSSGMRKTCDRVHLCPPGAREDCALPGAPAAPSDLRARVDQQVRRPHAAQLRHRRATRLPRVWHLGPRSGPTFLPHLPRALLWGAWSCKGRGFCPSCGGRRMNAGALTLVDHVLPDVPLRQFVVTVPFPLRFPLAFDGKLLGQVLRIFIDTVAANYRKRLADRGIPSGKHGAVAVIQRANSDLRCNPHIHAIFLDGLYAPDRDGKGFMFHPAPASTQEDVEAIVERASKRILRFLQRRGVITLVTAPGDGEVTVVTDETMGEEDPLLARLLAAATAGAPPAGPVNKRTRACPPSPCPTRLRRARRHPHRARPRCSPRGQGQPMRAARRGQSSCCDQGRRQRRAGPPRLVQIHPPPAAGQRPVEDPG